MKQPDTFPSGQTFRGVVVVPYTQLLDRWNDGDWHRGGPIWPHWESQVGARHCRAGKPIDVPPDAPEGVPDHVDALAWGGGIDPVFGHQIADFSARLLATMLARPELPIAFATKPEFGWRTIDEAPGFFRAILDWFGLPSERVHIVNEPTIVGELFVAPQAEQLYGPGPDAAYLEALDELTVRRLGEPPAGSDVPLYVSRAGISTPFAGEAYLERALEAAGARVMRPESHALLTQIRTYRDSRHIIYAEGSALHTLQLLGHIDTQVDVLVRRPGVRVAEASLAPRVRGLTYVEGTEHLLHSLAPSGRQSHHRGLPLLREDDIPAMFGRLGVDLAGHWDAAAFRRSRDEAVLAWIDVQATEIDRHGHGSVEYMLDGLGSMGLAHLVDEAALRLEPLRDHLDSIVVQRRPRDPDRPTVLLLHIPRTAGTAVREALETVVPEDERRYVYDDMAVEGAISSADFVQLRTEERSGLALVMGDFAYGLHEHLPGPARYVALMRHPISRVISLYHARAREAAAGGLTPAPLAEWVFSDRRIEADNAMVRAISGRPGVPFGSCTDDMLEEAIAHIEADFEAVLVRGSMQRSTVVLGRAIGATLPLVRVVNADSRGPRCDVGGEAAAQAHPRTQPPRRGALPSLFRHAPLSQADHWARLTTGSG